MKKKVRNVPSSMGREGGRGKERREGGMRAGKGDMLVLFRLMG